MDEYALTSRAEERAESDNALFHDAINALYKANNIASITVKALRDEGYPLESLLKDLPIVLPFRLAQALQTYFEHRGYV